MKKSRILPLTAILSLMLPLFSCADFLNQKLGLTVPELSNHYEIQFTQAGSNNIYEGELLPAFTDTNWEKLNYMTDVLEINVVGTPAAYIDALYLRCYDEDGTEILPSIEIGSNLQQYEKFSISRLCSFSTDVTQSKKIYYELSYSPNSLDDSRSVYYYNFKVTPKDSGFLLEEESNNCYGRQLKFDNIVSSGNSAIEFDKYLNTSLKFDSPVSSKNAFIRLLYNDNGEWIDFLNFSLGAIAEGHNEITSSNQIKCGVIPAEGWSFDKCRYEFGIINPSTTEKQIIFWNMKITASIDDSAKYENSYDNSNISGSQEIQFNQSGEYGYFYNAELISVFTGKTSLSCLNDVIEVTIEGIPNTDVSTLYFQWNNWPTESSDLFIINENKIAENLNKGEKFSVTRQFALPRDVDLTSLYLEYYTLHAYSQEDLSISEFKISATQKSVGFVLKKTYGDYYEYEHEIMLSQVASSESSVIRNGQVFNAQIEFDSPIDIDQMNIHVANHHEEYCSFVYTSLGSIKEGYNIKTISVQIDNSGIPDEGAPFADCDLGFEVYGDNVQTTDDQIILSNMKVTVSIDNQNLVEDGVLSVNLSSITFEKETNGETYDDGTTGNKYKTLINLGNYCQDMEYTQGKFIKLTLSGVPNRDIPDICCDNAYFGSDGSCVARVSNHTFMCFYNLTEGEYFEQTFIFESTIDGNMNNTQIWFQYTDKYDYAWNGHMPDWLDEQLSINNFSMKIEIIDNPVTWEVKSDVGLIKTASGYEENVDVNVLYIHCSEKAMPIYGVDENNVADVPWRDLDIDAVVFDDHIESIERNTFYRTPASYNIASVTLPSSLKYIGTSAFFSNGIKELTVPSSVRYIGYQAFGNWEPGTLILNWTSDDSTHRTLSFMDFTRNGNYGYYYTNSFRYKEDELVYAYDSGLVPVFTDANWTELNCMTDVLEITVEGIAGKDLSALYFKYMDNEGEYYSEEYSVAFNLTEGESFSWSTQIIPSRNIKTTDKVYYELYYKQADSDEHFYINDYQFIATPETVGFVLTDGLNSSGYYLRNIRFDQIVVSGSCILKRNQYVNIHMEFYSLITGDESQVSLELPSELNFALVSTPGGVIQGYNEMNMSMHLPDVDAIPEEGVSTDECMFCFRPQISPATDDQIILSNMKITASIDDSALYDN